MDGRMEEVQLADQYSVPQSASTEQAFFDVGSGITTPPCHSLIMYTACLHQYNTYSSERKQK